ncbi:MAG: hypothetical protein AABZ06_07505 [Bdellovibrionota bacterium]
MKTLPLALISLVFGTHMALAGSYFEVTDVSLIQEQVSKDFALATSGLTTTLNKILDGKLVCGSTMHIGLFAVHYLRVLSSAVVELLF